MPSQIIAASCIEKNIMIVRGHKVMIDEDLAVMYGVETKLLIRAVKRNTKRFPSDFTFQLTNHEVAALRRQSGTSNEGRGGRRYLPYAFTEQGVAMLSCVLRSSRAIAVNVEIMRAFVNLRHFLQTNSELAAKIETMEKKCDGAFAEVFGAIRRLMDPITKEQRQIGFKSANER